MPLSPEAEARIFGDAPPAPAAVTPVPAVAPVAPVAPAAQPAPTEIPGLFDAIRAERDAKEARAKADAESASAAKERDDYKAKLATITRAKDDILLDTVKYLTELGLDQRGMALVAESVMYHMVPDKAPPDHRARIVEAQMQRDRKLSEEREANRGKEDEARRAREAAEYGKRMEADYAAQLAEAAKGFGTTCPDSTAWFGSDHDSYGKSLMITARNMAEAAQRAGTRADLSPASVAKVLEADLTERFKRVRGAGAAVAPTQAVTPQAKVEPAQVQVPLTPSNQSTLSAQALTEKQRLARALEAAFKSQ